MKTTGNQSVVVIYNGPSRRLEAIYILSLLYIIALPTNRSRGEMMKNKFESGRIYMTPGVIAAVERSRMDECLARHLIGDWGSVPQEDKDSNDEAVHSEDSLYSAYAIDPEQPCAGFGDNTFWIITEWDRSVTTILLPNER